MKRLLLTRNFLMQLKFRASHSEQRVDQGREGTNQLQKVEMERERRDVKGANSLDIWRKLAMNMFMILTHHHLLLQSQRERESRKKSLTTDLHPQFATPPRPITSMQTTSPMTRRRLLEVEPFTPTRAISYVQTPSPVTRSRKRVLELEGYIEPVACLALSPVAGTPKGRVKKLKVVRSKMN
ncbi:uncharacterized protein LOC120656345 isoform X3 [Panicum virgatum]|uniref:uncharacterized protein LOC120656345 isoform X3 n=1 Tax=Panicum virgatum TaxID=38727 RepID=UPI0019D53212|nr:uncharacterized protein LOC120656345 isoform X3 [Panicum virgatum]